MNLTVTQKTQILDKIEQYIETRFFNPLAELPAWKESWPEARGWIQARSGSEDFEERVRQSLAQSCGVLSWEWPRRSGSLCSEHDVPQIR